MVSLITPVISLFLHILSIVMSKSDTPLFPSWVVDPHLRDLYRKYSYSVTTSFPINFIFLFLTYSNTSLNTTSSAAMSTGFLSSSWNMDPLLVPLFPRATINNTIYFLTSIPESVIYATRVRWYISPVTPLNISSNPMIIYYPISYSFSRPESKCYLVTWRSSNNISCPLNYQAILITKASHALVYSIFVHPYCTWAYSSNTLSASKITGMLMDKFLLVTCTILFRHPRKNFSTHSNLLGDLDRLPVLVSFPNLPWVNRTLHRLVKYARNRNPWVIGVRNNILEVQGYKKIWIYQKGRARTLKEHNF